MKKIFVAVFATLLLSLSACDDAGTEMPATQPAEPAQIQQTEQACPSGESGTREIIAQTGTAVEILDEPTLYEGSIEESVSYSITVPKVTLENSEATNAVNAFYADFAQNLVDYASNDVYNTAMEKHAIGALNGGYSISANDGKLMVDYTLSESYTDNDSDNQRQRTDIFDLSTGELLETQAAE